MRQGTAVSEAKQKSNMSSLQDQKGYGKEGIQKGSEAADLHGRIGNVDKSSPFAGVQCAGAKGNVCGFGPDGVQKGSPAAAKQSDIGDVPPGHDFSKLQNQFQK